jgi:hypothetical protein
METLNRISATSNSRKRSRSPILGKFLTIALLGVLALIIGLAGLHNKTANIPQRLNGPFTVMEGVTFQMGDLGYRESRVLVVEDDFFDDRRDLFILGQSHHAFDDTESVVITEKAAGALFNDHVPEVAVARCGNRNMHCQLRITGVIRNVRLEGAPEADFFISRRLYQTVLAGTSY